MLRTLSTVETRLTELGEGPMAGGSFGGNLGAPVEVDFAPLRGSGKGLSQFRPLAAAAAGLVIGLFSASMLFAYMSGAGGKTISLLQEGFEAGNSPAVTGWPTSPGYWSGDYSTVLGENQGVKPAGGKKMLQFLRSDYEGKPPQFSAT